MLDLAAYFIHRRSLRHAAIVAVAVPAALLAGCAAPQPAPPPPPQPIYAPAPPPPAPPPVIRGERG
jgi:hypothetical protein